MFLQQGLWWSVRVEGSGPDPGATRKGEHHMADWRKVAIAAFLADGKIDEAEVKILKKELYADGKIDAAEVKFLIELRETAQKKAKTRKEEVGAAFEKLFFKAIEDNVLKDGKIDDAEAKWLRTMLFADGKIDDNEKKFLETLKKKAKTTSASFTKLYDEAMAKAAKAVKK
jgi:uncharacterized membrane protein YebE (DUF533 family)